jgi:hypothetical protein
MAMRFLLMLIRHDYPFPTVGVELIVNGLINDALVIRKVSLRLCIEFLLLLVFLQLSVAGLTAVLHQHKHKHKKVTVNVEKEGKYVFQCNANSICVSLHLKKSEGQNIVCIAICLLTWGDKSDNLYMALWVGTVKQ